jgi:hypothetical protein
VCTLVTNSIPATPTIIIVVAMMMVFCGVAGTAIRH